MSGPLQSTGAELKGIVPESELAVSETLRKLKAGSLKGLAEPSGGLPRIILGSRLAGDLGMMLDSNVTVISPQGQLTPFGPHPTSSRFHVAGLFDQRRSGNRRLEACSGGPDVAGDVEGAGR